MHEGELAAVAQPHRLLHSTPAQEPSLYGILQLATANNLKVKAVGSGHSYSPVATTSDLLLETHGLKRLASLDSSSYIFGQQDARWLAAGAPPLVTVPSLPPWDVNTFDPSRRALVEVEGGITLLELVEQLEKSQLGLLNMGE